MIDRTRYRWLPPQHPDYAPVCVDVQSLDLPNKNKSKRYKLDVGLSYQAVLEHASITVNRYDLGRCTTYMTLHFLVRQWPVEFTEQQLFVVWLLREMLWRLFDDGGYTPELETQAHVIRAAVNEVLGLPNGLPCKQAKKPEPTK